MSKVDPHQIEIPDSMSEGWSKIVNLLAEITNVPSALIMRIHPNEIEVFSSNDNKVTPYSIGDKESLGQGLYCETVVSTQRELIVPNALKDPDWDSNPDIKLGMISYCGIPLNWPNGEPFGTMCILDDKENHYSELYRNLLSSFRVAVESQLTTLYQHAKLINLNRELKYRVNTRTKDLANLNYSLTQEIDRRKAAEHQLTFQKFHDIGTGFLNRMALENELNEKLLNSVNKSNVAVIHIGFNNGQRIQTKYGHQTLDQLLVMFRERVGNFGDFTIVTARRSSTDLVLIVDALDMSSALNTLCNRMVEVAQSEFFIDSIKLHLNAYIGISTSIDTQLPNELLQFAHEAMLACKDSGHKFAFYAESNTHCQSQINQIENSLLQAVRRDELMLYFQPKVEPGTNRWVGAEALLRWSHPLLGEVSNETLIRMAEQNGLIFEVGTFVLRSAIEKAAAWSKVIDDFKIAINVSAVQLKNEHFAGQVASLLEHYKVDARFLEIEVTESGLISDESTSSNTLEKLHKLGVTLSLDDFGTGYASFSYLKKYPFDCIKIDRLFVTNLKENKQDREIIRSIISIAKKLDLKVVIEGVESKEHENFIVQEGCDFGQGYFYGKPMPSDEFERSFINHAYLGTKEFHYQ
ncbi:GGDEF and EAL domain-containing protein [Vibrio maerlii]|uniref:sensor domain-containing phosphodiesterase n=1 Tax=Vibrio maerlii TaxID=2231648 RepID=UPI000E3D46B3|nr:GGDEF and EAL domain-containing protein [Vibrio maerlii]